ncbi:MAG TPA: prepilin-type N-terminal cleavage/methylation domain-containing protein [Candidatus Baltobacteraceae bacterium]
MNLRRQSGITLLETTIAAALLAIAAGGALFALSSFGAHIAQQGGPARMAALVAAQQTLRIAQDAWKYGSPGSAPSGSQTIALPLSTQTTAPALLTTTVSAGATSAQITVTVQYTPEPGRSGDPGVVMLSANVSEKAPLPGSQVTKPGLVPLPSGAP